MAVNGEAANEAGTAPVAEAVVPRQARPPLFFERPEMLDPVRHAGLRIDRNRRNYRFARHSALVPLALVEFGAAGVDYPIIFTSDPEPVAVVALGYRKGDNVFVGDDGAWLPWHYLPAYVRAYPFAVIAPPADTPQPDRRGVVVDTASDLLSLGDGELLLEGGHPTQVLRGIMEVAEAYRASVAVTNELGRLLAQNGLLVPYQATVPLPDGSVANVADFRAVDPQRLAVMREKTLTSWRQRGFLAAIYQHLQSLNCWNHIARAAQIRAGEA